MYKTPSKQLSFEDFNQPLGLHMDPNNRWIKKAAFIPWDLVEKKYKKLFKGFKGHVAKPARMELGALLIQIEYGYSDEETVEQIKENPYLQYFCGLLGYEYKAPFDASAMTRFRKRLTPKRLEAINNFIIQQAEAAKQAPHHIEKETDKKEDSHHDDTPPSTSDKEGTLIVDATCAPSRIKYPRDMELLNEGREKLEHIITVLHTPTDGKKPRTYCRKARKDYLNIVRAKKNKAKKLRHGIRKQLQYLARDQRYIADLLQDGRPLAHKYQQQLTVIQQMYAQQKYMYDHHIHRMEHRIVNLRQPFLRPIVRGKVKAPVEFGAKLDISVVNGMVRLERQSFETYNESTLLPQEIERYQDRYGHYPERVLADKIYRNRVNLAYCKERGIRLSGPALGRPKKDAVRDRRLEYKDNCDRVEVERAFSLAKRRFGLTEIRTYLKETTQSVIALSILALNLGKLQAIQCTPILFYLQVLLWKVKRALKWLPCQKVAFVQ